MRINILDSSIYNRISAGEVVERPQSVVKELVENSIDANATKVSVYITNGGIDEIVVIDNGSGIHRDDLKKAFMPHATSKITTVNDLDCIATMGFRGEALASIASVSKVSIKTRTSDCAYAVCGEFRGLDLVEETGVSGNVGTTMTIRNLFYNVPARAKYLKSPRAEEQAITATIIKLMISNNNISINYYINGKEKYSTHGNGLLNALTDIFGDTFTNDLIEVNYSHKNMTLTGYIGNTNLTRNNRSMQFLNINDRVVNNATVSTAVSKGYNNRMFTSAFPVYILNISMPLDELDINVTPNKSDVRFYDSDSVFSLVFHGVMKALNDFDLSQSAKIKDNIGKINFDEPKKISNIANQNSNTQQIKPQFSKDFSFDVPLKDEITSTTIKNINEKYEQKTQKEKTETQTANTKDSNDIIDYTNIMNTTLCSEIEFDKDGSSVIRSKSSLLKVIGNIKSSEYLHKPVHLSEINSVTDCTSENIGIDPKIENILNNTTSIDSVDNIEITQTNNTIINEEPKLLGVVFSTYMLIEKGNSTYWIDIHAANERILFDKLVSEYNSTMAMSQPLLISEYIPLSAIEISYITQLLPSLNSLGFEAELFGEDIVKISAVPACLIGINIHNFIQSVANKSFTDLKLGNILVEKIALVACKSSVKAGENFNDEQLIEMYKKIFSGNFPLNCPHGRPIFVEITKNDLDKRFKRK